MMDAEKVSTDGEAVSDGEGGSLGESPPETEVEFIGGTSSGTDMEPTRETTGEIEVGAEKVSTDGEVGSTEEAPPRTDVEPIRTVTGPDIESAGEDTSETDVETIGKAILGMDLESIGGATQQKAVKQAGKVRPRERVGFTERVTPEGEFEVSDQEKELDELSEMVSSPESYSDVSPWEIGGEETNASATTTDTSRQGIYEPMGPAEPTEPIAEPAEGDAVSIDASLFPPMWFVTPREELVEMCPVAVINTMISKTLERGGFIWLTHHDHSL